MVAVVSFKKRVVSMLNRQSLSKCLNQLAGADTCVVFVTAITEQKCKVPAFGTMGLLALTD